jgi:hypothetical protein
MCTLSQLLPNFLKEQSIEFHQKPFTMQFFWVRNPSTVHSSCHELRVCFCPISLDWASNQGARACGVARRRSAATINWLNFLCLVRDEGVRARRSLVVIGNEYTSLSRFLSARVHIWDRSHSSVPRQTHKLLAGWKNNNRKRRHEWFARARAALLLRELWHDISPRL